jgi:integrase
MRDIYKKEIERFDNWLEKSKKSGIEGLNNIYSNLVIQYCEDMGLGINMSLKSKRGGRSKKRINCARQKMVYILKRLQDRNLDNITKIKKEDFHLLFKDMRTGVLKTRLGTPYKSTGDYVKEIRCFWRWYMRRYNYDIDTTRELDSRCPKAKFIYFTEDEFNKMIKIANRDLQIAMILMWDAGCRVKELMNIQASDFSKDFKELQIKEETAKTFGRRIKLMFCSEQVKDYINDLDLKLDDYIVKLSPEDCNNKLNEIGLKILGKERCKDKKLTLYDFRHSSACFWVVRYKSESALKYRFGWKKSEMIHYYTEFLGMEDTIQQDDLYTDITKTEMEKEIEKLKKSIKEVKMMKMGEFSRLMDEHIRKWEKPIKRK